MTFPLLDTLHWRYATKTFDNTKQVSEQQIERIIEAMRLAPSSFGIQPWRFYVIKDNDLRQKIQEAAWNQSQITEASALLIIAYATALDDADIERYIQHIHTVRNVPIDTLDGYKQMMLTTLHAYTKEERTQWCAKQAYIAAGFGMMACAIDHIDCCPMEGFDSSIVSNLIGSTTHGYAAGLLLPIGYRSPNDTYASAKKVRYDASDVVQYI